MIQTQDLQTLYNGLIAVETKGDSTRTMANCLNYLLDLIRKSQQEPVAQPVPPMPTQAPEPVPVPEPVPKQKKKRKPESVDMPADPVVDVVDTDQVSE